jgi:ribosome-binding protein aMBF1 (putative translation factor)
MARRYDESATIRSAPARRGTERAAVFGQTYRLAAQAMEQPQLLRLAQTELAEKTNIDQCEISKIELGSIFPNENTLLRLADALGAEWRMAGKAAARIQLRGGCRATECPRERLVSANTVRS